VRKPSRVVAIAVLVFLFAVNVYRAATQSITHDEALTYLLFLTGDFRNIFTINNPNNHLLVTLLMRLSTTLFGVSEFSVRLPVLVTCGLYLFTVYQFSLLLFGGGLLFILTVILLAANPLVLDFFVAARGYGPALAFLFYGVYCLFLYRTRSRYRWNLLYRGAVSLSFAVMSNLAVLFPTFVAAALFLMTLPPRPAPRKQTKRSREPQAVFPGRGEEAARFLVPVSFLAMVFWMAMPVTASPPGGLYTTYSGLAGSLEDLVGGAFLHNSGLGQLNRDTVLLTWWRNLLALVMLPGVAIGGLIAALRTRERPAKNLALLWSSGIVVGSMFLHVVGDLLAHIPYPADRTGLYFFPFIGLALVLLLCVLRERAGILRWTALPLTALGCLLAFHYAIQFNWTHFYVWAYDADNKAIIRELESIHRRAGKPIDLGYSWQLSPSLAFYRDAWRLDWLNPVIRSREIGTHEYYALIANDRHLVKERNLETLFEGRMSGAILARQ